MELVLGFTRGDVPDYQMAAWCMAVYFKGLSGRETHSLTDAMIRSGETLDLGRALGRRVVDKHSTGGVGDKTSLAVGPIVAACGVPFGKMSGRGLGHTGGTLDKLEAIPGFGVELDIDAFVEQVRTIGLAIIGQTGDLVPADKKLYALRDVTATVDIVPLIASSIMSKKLAAGADAIVLDVKVGDGAFMKTVEDARILAEQMVDLGRREGREVVCLLTDMDQPLGRTVGNALEVREAVETIDGQGPPRLHGARPRRLRATARALRSRRRPRRRAATRRGCGRGRVGHRRLRALDPRPGRRPGSRRACPSRPSSARSSRRATASSSASARSRSGIAALELGAGRRTKEDSIDHAVGVVCHVKRGDSVSAGDVLAEVHARDDASASTCRRQPCSPRTRSASELPHAHGILLDVVALMPELPEVETIRSQLAPRLEGRTLVRVEILDPRLTRPYDLFEVAEELEGDTRRRRRAAREVPARPARERARSPRAPADDRELRLRAGLARARRPRARRRFARSPTATSAGSGPGSSSRTPTSSRTSRRRTARSRSGRGSRRAGSRRSSDGGRRRSRPCSSTSASSPASGTSTRTRRSGAPA